MVQQIYKKIMRLEKEKDFEILQLEMYSIIVGIILSKDIFTRNKDLEKLYNLTSIEIKPYLLKSRNQTISKFITIIKNSDEQELHTLINILKKFLLEIDFNSFSKDKKNSKKNNKINSEKNDFNILLKKYGKTEV